MHVFSQYASFKERRERFCCHGPAEEKALQFIASLLAQKGELLLGFHPFGDQLQVQTVRHGDDGPDDRPVAVACGDVPDKGLVNLQEIQGELFQVVE